MTKATRVVLIVGLMMMMAGLFPPGQIAHRTQIRARWGPRPEPQTYYTNHRVFFLRARNVQYRALMVEWAIIAAGTGAAFLLVYRRRP